ncbi:MAG TPA: hypothetical protein VGD45_06720 [Steroidobacter sp.]|uniref:hypothetical protein n=1 Tax=Steroidobacter sp. TaxID=1978227 RepID=UPI002ED98263
MTLRTTLAAIRHRARSRPPVEKAADCVALSVLLMSAKYLGWMWLAYAGAALGAGSFVAMIYFYFRKQPAASP